MGSRFALEPGRGQRRAPVVPSLIGSTVAVLVVVGTLVISSSLDGLLDSPERYGAPWDLQVSTGASDYDTVATQLADDDRVDDVSVMVSGELTAVGTLVPHPVQGFTVGLDSVKGSVGPVVLEGRAPVGSNEILVGSTTMRRQGIEIGDEVEISGPNGSETVVVVGRAVVPVVSASSPDEGLVVPLETFTMLGGTETVADIDVEATVLATADESDVEAVGTSRRSDRRDARRSVPPGECHLPRRGARHSLLPRRVHRLHRHALGVPHAVRHLAASAG